jgi:hypothetical protein
VRGCDSSSLSDIPSLGKIEGGLSSSLVRSLDDSNLERNNSRAAMQRCSEACRSRRSGSNGLDAAESTVDSGCLIEDEREGPCPPQPDVSIE